MTTATTPQARPSALQFAESVPSYRIFAFMFAFGVFAHARLGWGMWRPKLILLFGVALVWAFPRFVPALPILAVSTLVYYWIELPSVANHLTFDAFLALSVLFVFAVALVRGRGRADPAELTTLLKSAVKPAVILVYFLAVLSKLNWDFLNPALSCGSGLVNHVKFLHGSKTSFLGYAGVYSTLVVEGGIPILLVVRRWVLPGIIFGVLFHLVTNAYLTTINMWPTPLFAGYSLFLSDGFWEEARALPGLRFREFVDWRWGVGIFFAVIFSWWIPIPHFQKVFSYGVYPLYCVIIIAVVVFVWARTKTSDHADRVARRLDPVLLVPCGLLFLSSMTPYLGYKTLNSNTMFSNLRTEGGRTNHLFLPISMQIFKYQRQLYEVVRVKHDGGSVRKKQRFYLLIDLAILLDSHKGMKFTARRVSNGATITEKDIRHRFGFLAKKFFVSRKIYRKDRQNRKCHP